MENEALDDDFKAMLDELTSYHAQRFREAQARRRRKSIAANMDGRWDFYRVLTALHADDLPRQARYEFEISQRIADQVGRAPQPGCIFVPISGRRDLTTSGDAGFLVGSDVGPGNLFVHYLDQFFHFERLGIQRLTLQRPATIPGVAGNVTTTWLSSEGSSLSETDFTFATSATTPKTVGAYIELSGQFLKQGGPFAQNFVMAALARAVAAELSRKILVGSGAAGQIQGVFGYSGINTVAAGSANYSKVLDMLEAVEADSALLNPASAGFVMPAAVAKLLRSRERATGSGTIMLGTEVSGYPGIVTEGSSPNTLTFGDWSQLVLLEYGILEIGRDPYGVPGANLFQSGRVGIRAFWTVDSVLLNPSSFVTSGGLN
ncbi:phage major capsid protein [Nitrospira sp. BLG_2]|uniref:phage major capsid protein n=1 Tax=Nitrospira sp. BLG_2 TaxID=3397507 RepID=UPI003B9C9651